MRKPRTFKADWKRTWILSMLPGPGDRRLGKSRKEIREEIAKATSSSLLAKIMIISLSSPSPIQMSGYLQRLKAQGLAKCPRGKWRRTKAGEKLFLEGRTSLPLSNTNLNWPTLPKVK